MTEKVKLTGRVKWTNRLFNPDVNPTDGKASWSVDFYPDNQDILFTFQAQGMKNTIRKDDDGMHAIYRRPTEKMMRGELVKFDPPKVTGPDGKAWDQNVMIGNGSKATVDLHIYEHNTPTGRKAKAARLEGVQITELVPYENKKSEEQTTSW